MDKDEAIEVIYNRYHFSGERSIVKFLDGERSEFQPDGELQQAVDVLGQDRVRQLLGLDGEMWMTVYTAKGPHKPEDRLDKIIHHLEILWEDGRVAYYDTRSIPKIIEKDHFHFSDQLVESFRQFQRWAGTHGLHLKPHFRTKNGGELLVFPDIFLVVRSQLGRLYCLSTSDRDTSGLQGVFPCADEKQDYDIEFYLWAVGSGVDWREYDSQTDLTTPDFGTHGAIKARIKSQLPAIVGEEWIDAEDEFPVESERLGWIDILCRHQNRRKYMIIEVKPTKRKDEIDKAFGQILRYKHQFINDSTTPNLDSDDVEMAIAAPDFFEFQQEAAKEIDIKLIKVGE